MEEENKEVKEVEKVIENNGEVALENNTNIKISDDVVSVIAGVAVSEVPGVAQMSGGFAGGISPHLALPTVPTPLAFSISPTL